MIGAWVDRAGSNKLLVMILGWSCDENMLSHFRVEGYDIYCTYNYTDLDSSSLFVDVPLSEYSEISVVAWSFGVWAAPHIIGLLPRIDRAVAVNGTPVAVDDKYGIPRRGFKVTVWAVNMLGLDKFNERMVGEYSDDFIPAKREFADQIEELKALAAHFTEPLAAPVKWDVAVVGSKDSIVPTENQFNYWREQGVRCIEADLAHYPYTCVGIDIITELLNDR